MKQLLSKMKLRANVIVFMLALFFALPIGVRAASSITVNFGAGFPISETNLAPGQTFERTFSVTNITNSDQDLMIRFNDQVGQWQTGSYDIEGMISVRLQEPDGTLTTMPNGSNNELLSDLYKYDQAFLFDTLPGTDHDLHSYKLIFTFSSDAGNNYQNKKTVFDLAVGIDAQPAPANHHRHHHHNNNNGGGGNDTAPIPGIRGISGATTPGEIQGTETPNDENVINGEIPEVAGAENMECSSWPLWVWILMLVVYVIAINTNFYYEAKEKVRWFFPLVWTAAIFLIWYYFEKCRLYSWYPYLIIIIAIVSFFVYLSWLKRKAKTALQGEDE